VLKTREVAHGLPLIHRVNIGSIQTKTHSAFQPDSGQEAAGPILID